MDRNVTAEYIKKAYPNKYGDMSIEQIESKIRYYYDLAELAIKSYYRNKHEQSKGNSIHKGK